MVSSMGSGSQIDGSEFSDSGGFLDRHLYLLSQESIAERPSPLLTVRSLSPISGLFEESSGSGESKGKGRQDDHAE